MLRSVVGFSARRDSRLHDRMLHDKIMKQREQERVVARVLVWTAAIARMSRPGGAIARTRSVVGAAGQIT
jgi:hypothetical protein